MLLLFCFVHSASSAVTSSFATAHTMANVVTHPHLQVGFHPGPVGHSPSPLGFGFGLTQPSMMQGWPTAPHTQPPAWGFPPQTLQAPTRITKRRHEPEEEDRDERMDRSPTPERPKRAVPKRARTTPAAAATAGKEQNTAKENKPPTASDESDVDVGFLLGTCSFDCTISLYSCSFSKSPSAVTSAFGYLPAFSPTCSQVYHPLPHSTPYSRQCVAGARQFRPEAQGCLPVLQFLLPAWSLFLE